MLYTSYFAKMKSQPITNQYSIARWTPKWFKGKILLDLAPQAEWLNLYKNGKLSEEDYTKLYIEYLENNREKILKLVKSLPDGSFLLCFETSNSFCHRKVLASWLQRNNIKIEEYKKN